jgi:hypothetical protein
MKQGVGLVKVIVDVAKVKEVTPEKRGPKILNACAEHTDDCKATTASKTNILGITKCILK